MRSATLVVPFVALACGIAAVPLACSSSSTTPAAAVDAGADAGANPPFQFLDAGQGTVIAIQGQGTVSGGGDNLPDGAPIFRVYCTNVDAALPAIEASDAGPCYAPMGTTLYALTPPSGGWVFVDWLTDAAASATDPTAGPNTSTSYVVDTTTGPTLTAVFASDDASIPDAALPSLEDAGGKSTSPTDAGSGG